MNLLVTGGLGFIGSNFIRSCFQDPTYDLGWLVNLDKMTYAGNPSNLADLDNEVSYQFVRGDIGDSALVTQLLHQYSIDIVANFAAESHVDRSIDSPEAFFQTNVIGTLHLTEAARQYWKTLPSERSSTFRFLHLSTDEVFGSLTSNDPPWTEDTPYAPNSPYAASKASSNYILRSYHKTYGLPVITTISCNNFGPFQFPEKLIPLIIVNAIHRKSLPVYGDGNNLRDWLHVSDHCEALRMLIRKGSPGEVYNIGGNMEKTNLEVVNTVCDTLSRLSSQPGSFGYGDLIRHDPDRPGHDFRYALNTDKLRSQLYWKPKRDFEEAVTETVEWYLANRKWWQKVLDDRYDGRRLGLNSG